MKATLQYLRKFILISLIPVIAFTNALAQDDDSKGPILPQAGDWALSFNAVPVLDFALNAVNIMNNTGDGAQHPGFTEGYNQVLTGKYFIDANTAYRARFGFNTLRDSQTDFFTGLDIDGEAVDYENVITEASSVITLGLGYEKRRGRNRLQGFFGGEGIAGLERSRQSIDYGFDYSEQHGTPVGSQRTLEAKDGTTSFFGIRGFIGVEYFFARKMSVGAEFGLGLALSNTARDSQEIERYELDDFGNPHRVTETNDLNSKSRSVSTQMDDGFAAINLSFHF